MARLIALIMLISLTVPGLAEAKKQKGLTTLEIIGLAAGGVAAAAVANSMLSPSQSQNQQPQASQGQGGYSFPSAQVNPGPWINPNTQNK